VTPEIDLGAAVAALAEGAVIGIPTDTVYGLAVDLRQPNAVARLFEAKGRPDSAALPVLVASAGAAEELGRFDESARALAAQHWPGALTLVVTRQKAALDWRLGGDETTIGLRVPDHPIALALLARTGALAVTSANRHGMPPCQTAAQVRDQLGAHLLVLDGGTCAGEPSTVASLLGREVEILRRGAVWLG
jgi:L-threonylcarbamoyladenylate synthase